MLGKASVPSQALELREDTIQAASVKATSDVPVPDLTSVKTVPADPSQGEGMYVASKSGTKYHLPWCSGAQRIKEENKIWFATKEAAEEAGYEPAANCKGI